jgi:putative ABC transport system ATP-binding protein
MAVPDRVRFRDFARWAGPLLGPDRPFITLTLIYGVGIALLSLATPIAVQLLINSVAYTGLPVPLFTLSAILLVLLLLSAVLGALRYHLMELFRRRFLARIVAEVTLRTVHAQNPFFEDERRSDLFNRYFDIMNLQKALPKLLIGAFTIILQAVIGFVVTSFYHPFFLAFNLAFALFVWLIWALWANGAMTSAVHLSHAKYRLAHWIETIGGSNGFYKSSRHLDFAMDRTEERTRDYVEAHRRHFRFFFPQAVALLILYAIASAGLLALGGWLVIKGQLSVGQLVAAELILASIFYGAAQLGPYLDSLYDVVAGSEELSLFREITQEVAPNAAAARKIVPTGDLQFSAVRIPHPSGGEARFDFTIPANTRLLAHADTGTERLFSGLLKRHYRATSGLIALGGADIADFDVYELRSEIVVLNRPTIVETTIREYLGLSCAQRDPVRTMDALRTVGLHDRISELKDGLDTQLSVNGAPLDPAEVMALKLAGALVGEPHILVLSELYDMVPTERLRRAFDLLGSRGVTVIYFSNRPQDLALDAFLWMGRGEQRLLSNRAEFDRARGAPS